MEKRIIIDGKNAILGRLASYAAKQSLLGKEIAIVNCNEVVISGNSRSVIGEYKKSRTRGGSSLKGPFFPKIPERVVKRTIRGMLSHKQRRGNTALKRIKCYNQVPEEFKDLKKIVSGKEKHLKTIKLKELSREL